MSREGWLICGMLVVGCGAAESDAPVGGYGVGLVDEMPEDLPAGECRDDDCDQGESSGGVDAAPAAAEQRECRASDDCDGAGSCVAEFEDQQRGAFACRFACVPSLDEHSWCGGDASCCDPHAVCTARGYCVVSPNPARTGAGKTEGDGPEISDQMPEDLPAGDGTPNPVASRG